MLPSYVILDSGTYTVLYNGTSKQGSTCCVAVALLRNQGLCCMWDSLLQLPLGSGVKL